MAKVTMQQIVELGACDIFQERFRALFGEEAEVTIENAEKLQKVYGTWLYDGGYLLSAKGRYQLNEYAERLRLEGKHDAPVDICPGCAAHRAKFVEIYNREHDNATRSV